MLLFTFYVPYFSFLLLFCEAHQLFIRLMQTVISAAAKTLHHCLHLWTFYSSLQPSWSALGCCGLGIHELMSVGAHLPFHCSKGTDCIDACVNFVGREWDRGLPVGAGNPLQRSVLYVQADGESYSFCVCVCLFV